MKRDLPGLSWPRLNDSSNQVACHFCDALQQAPRLPEGDAAHCCRCGELIYQNRPRSLARATGFSSAALVFMLIAHLFPCITLQAGGTRTALTIVEAAMTFYHDGSPLIAIAAIVFTVVAPLTLVGGLLYVAAPLRFGIALPGAVTVTRIFQLSEPWSMVEVFLVGILVALLKLGSVGHIHLGTGLWALAGLVLCTACAMAGIDRLELWDRLEIALARSK
ncbi:paraquat-inducible protein A [Luteolibacter marinus]|uniref:paraquat-inducible protein A n=1 Tax=Luteolibacter marinus TaxID=2776705 RepID=UPI00186747B5|nr:paraquat-inducible protein A [Luteolibacter marinus]